MEQKKCGFAASSRDVNVTIGCTVTQNCLSGELGEGSRCHCESKTRKLPTVELRSGLWRVIRT